MVKKRGQKLYFSLFILRRENLSLLIEKNIMIQDTYKWVLQIYFICSTFVANKKNISMTRKRKKDKSFCREFICRCIDFKLVHLFFCE